MTPALDPVRLDALKKLAEAATPGPWTWGSKFICQKRDDGTYKYLAEAAPGEDDSPRWCANAAYIAYIAAMSPDTTLALLAERAGFLARIAELEAERGELQAVFDGTWKADQRAIKRWQAANPGNDLVWPDRADMVVWLLGREAELEAGIGDSIKQLNVIIADGIQTDWRLWRDDLAALLPKASVREEREDATDANAT